jgi:hypothetical protein
MFRNKHYREYNGFFKSYNNHKKARQNAVIFTNILRAANSLAPKMQSKTSKYKKGAGGGNFE